jgi:hypothetical protein
MSDSKWSWSMARFLVGAMVLGAATCQVFAETCAYSVIPINPMELSLQQGTYTTVITSSIHDVNTYINLSGAGCGPQGALESGFVKVKRQDTVTLIPSTCQKKITGTYMIDMYHLAAIYVGDCSIYDAEGNWIGAGYQASAQGAAYIKAEDDGGTVFEIGALVQSYVPVTFQSAGSGMWQTHVFTATSGCTNSSVFYLKAEARTEFGSKCSARSEASGSGSGGYRWSSVLFTVTQADC